MNRKEREALVAEHKKEGEVSIMLGATKTGAFHLDTAAEIERLAGALGHIEKMQYERGGYVVVAAAYARRALDGENND